VSETSLLCISLPKVFNFTANLSKEMQYDSGINGSDSLGSSMSHLKSEDYCVPLRADFFWNHLMRLGESEGKVHLRMHLIALLRCSRLHFRTNDGDVLFFKFCFQLVPAPSFCQDKNTHYHVVYE
jgi:hypothetical protein